MQKSFSPKLCGFRKKHSTQHALLKLIKELQSCLDKSEYAGMVLMDLSKAYDCIPHDLLIAKLAAYGLDLSSLNVIYSYLCDRKQRVKIGSTFSAFLKVIIGVPQGSILGPLLFNIFLNDLLISYESTLICNFADDNTLYSFGENLNVVKSKLQVGIDHILIWFKINSMVANPDKFQLIFFGPKLNTSHHSLNLRIGDINLENQDDVRLLGVVIDSKLTFKKHISKLCESSSQKLWALRRIRKYLNFEQAQVLSNSFVMSNFRYCNLIWMFCTKTENLRINQVHKQTLRFMYNEPSKSLLELLEEHGGHTIHHKNIQSLMLFIFQIIKGFSPDIAKDLFEVKNIKYILRAKDSLILPKCKTMNYGTNTVYFKGVLLWKSLPNSIKDSLNVETFKSRIKKWKPETCTCKICI